MAPNRFLGEFEQMIVASILRLGEDAYGVSIIDDIERHAGRKVRSGALSVTLDRMERKGLLSSRLGDPEAGRGGRSRRYVALTRAGLVAARESREALLAMWRDLEEEFGGR